jgi:general stress protein 26
MRDLEQIVGRLIDGQGTVFVGSIDGQGWPNIKAMLAPRKREGLRTFWLTTNTSSQRVAQWRANPKASLYFCDPGAFVGVLLTGTMEVLEDAASKELIWRDGDTIYYSRGVTDPDYFVLRFTATQGRIYSNLSSEDFTV